MLKLNLGRFLHIRRRAISPVIATIMIFGLIITGVMITFIQVLPYIEKAKSQESVSAVQNSFLELDTAIKSLISESGSPGGYRTVFVQKPQGRIDYIPNRNFVSFGLKDQDDNSILMILQEQGMGLLDWQYSSPQSLLPRGTTKFLTGPDPYKTRNPVFLTGTFSNEEYNDLTNLTLSHQNDRKHHISLNYRISVYLTISTQPNPQIQIQVFLIILSADFNSIFSQYKQFSIRSTQNISTPVNIPKNDSIAELNLVWKNEKMQTFDSLWNTKAIQGFEPKYFDIVIQTYIFEIGLSTT